MRFENSITIRRPIEEVFAYISDVQNSPTWQNPVRDARQTSPGPVGVGATFVQTVTLLGREFEVATEVTAYEPPRWAALKSTSGPMPIEITFTLTPEGAGTRVETVSETKPGGALKLAGPLAAQAARRSAQHDLDRLKRLLESGD